MKEITENGKIVVGYLLDNEIESSTLDLSINTYINGAILNGLNEAKATDPKYMMGYLMAEELIDDLNRGVRVLCSDSDIYLSKISLRYFVNFFEYCIRENMVGIGAREIGLNEDRFVIHAITSVMMIKMLPDIPIS